MPYSRKTRTNEQDDPRLALKTNAQCKDKFRNVCRTVELKRTERGLALPLELRARVAALIEKEEEEEEEEEEIEVD